ncbi:MAG: diguanylate cyclase [candidate division Zixibacteria bacterium]|nr:diguanylate cyclase [candidate division Zixibacteria bacterium]
MDRNKKEAISQIETVIVGGDLAIVTLAGLIYYYLSFSEFLTLSFSYASFFIWLNLLKVFALYFAVRMKAIHPNPFFKIFIFSNLIFIPVVQTAVPGSMGEYNFLYFILIIFSAYFWDYQRTLMVTLFSATGFLLVTLAQGVPFSLVHFLHLGFFALFFFFIKAIMNKMKNSRAKLMDAMDNLNQRTWELELAHGETEMIYNTVADIAGTIKLQELASKILEISTKSLGAKECKVYKVHPGGLRFYLIAEATADSVHNYKEPKKCSIEDCFSSVNIDYEKDTTTGSVKRFEEGVILSDDKGAMFIPLAARQQLLGAILLKSANDDGFSGSELRRYEALRSAASMALDNIVLMQKTEELAVVDELTGAYNFRYFKDKLSTEIHRAIRYKLDLSILMIDLDYFKKVNDKYGHEAGNMLLQQLSGLFARCIREVDILARYGGEEFVIILPQTGKKDAVMVAERIRKETELNVFECGPEAPEVRITVSIGVESFSRAYYKDTELFLKQTDKNLYKAKRTGRNRVVAYDEDQTSEIDPASIISPSDNYDSQ